MSSRTKKSMKAPQKSKKQAMCCGVVPALWRYGQKDEEFKVTLSYRMSSRPARVILTPCLKKQKSLKTGLLSSYLLYFVSAKLSKNPRGDFQLEEECPVEPTSSSRGSILSRLEFVNKLALLSSLSWYASSTHSKSNRANYATSQINHPYVITVKVTETD